MRYATHQVTDQDVQAVTEVLRSEWLTQGPRVEQFEAALCEYTGARYAVAVNSGTAALHLCYETLTRSTGSTLVMTTPLSFVATANAALHAGHEVVFGDVFADTGNMAPPLRRIKVAVPVHYGGRPADVRSLMAPTVIEDACHAMGAMDYDGCSRVGSCAHSLATAFSFHPVKPMTTAEGGAVTTNDQGFADEVRLLRSHGRLDGEMVALGFNYRMPDVLAALGLSQLRRVDEMRQHRLRLSEIYRELIPQFAPPPSPNSSWHLYPIRIRGGRRDAVRLAMTGQGIGVQVHYPCIHLQPYWRRRYGFTEGSYPEAEAWAAEELSLPLHAGMTRADVERVVKALEVAIG